MSVPRRTRILALVAIMVAGAAGFAYAWQNSQPLLRYRERRLMEAYNDEIRRYLKGSDSLDVAAHRLARVIVAWQGVVDREQWLGNTDQRGGVSEKGGWMAVTVNEAPQDIPRDDPRVEELVLNAFKLAAPAGVSDAFRAQSAQRWDSIIHAKGYRSIR